MKVPKTAKTVTEVKEIYYTVHVTKEDIRYATRGSTKTCAIARALKRDFSEKNVDVSDGDDITVDGYQADLDYEVRSIIDEFIGIFDDTDISRSKIKPFSFKIKLVKKEE